MRLALLLLLSAASLPAQFTVSVPVSAIAHPVRTFHRSPDDAWFRRAAAGVLEAVNFGDYTTTYRGVIRGPYCEQNPVFALPGCRINARRFTRVKLAVAVFGVAQELPEAFPAFRRWRGRASYERSAAFVNLGLAVPLGIALGNNFRVLAQ